MELIAAILIAGPLGYFIEPQRKALFAYLAAWAIVFPVQTTVVHSENPDDIQALYFVFNALILGLGIAMNTLGARLRARLAATAGALSS